MINALWHRWQRTLNEMAVKPSVLQYVAAASWGPIGKDITLLFYYNYLYLVWVGKGKEGDTKTMCRRDHTAFYSAPPGGLDVIRRVN